MTWISHEMVCKSDKGGKGDIVTVMGAHDNVKS